MISVRGWPDAAEYSPTAQALVAEVAVTAMNPGRLPGLGTRDQAVPFQCKILAPTAQALVGEVALTLNSGPTEAGLGLGTRDQAVPFQCRISALYQGSGVPHNAVQYCPTAQALAGEVALTLMSSDMVLGLGLAT
jgi:hypothetical protein